MNQQNISNYYNFPPAATSVPQAKEDQAGQSEGKWTYKDWLVKVVVPIIVAMITAGILFGPKPSPTPPSNTIATPTAAPSAVIPALHATYTGTATDLSRNIMYRFSLFNLTEDAQGNFQASATAGSCTAQITNGKVGSDGKVSFKYNQETNPNALCFPNAVDFSGQVNSAGTLSGSWTEENTPYNGSFALA